MELSRRIVDAPGYVEAWMDGLSELEAAFASLGDEWSAIKRSEAAYLQAWGQLLDRMTVEQQSLRLEGKRLTGPADLLGVIGRGRRETYHCALIAWLMDPSGRHGLGTSLLEEILHLVFPDALVTAERLLGAAPKCEVARPRSRADIVVWCPELTLVFEAKIDHIERDRQCEDLHEDFRTERGVRFIFLTPDGRDPETAKAVFMPLGMTELREALEAALGRVRPVGAGAATAYSYAETLRREFP